MMKYKAEYEKMSNKYAFLMGFAYALIDLLKESKDPDTSKIGFDREKQYREFTKG